MSEPTLPFPDEEAGDPSPAEEPTHGSRGRPYSVSEVNASARELLEGVFPEVWIEAEISNFKAHGSGHFYFSLRDASSQINSVMFRGANARLRFKPADGLQVLARGKVTLYEPRGAYQINVQWMEPLGAGSLQVAFEQLKARLQAEGLFDPARKRPIPALPRRVAIVTSPTGAAVRDILRVLERRFAGLDILIAPCRVQGDEAAAEIAAAIDTLNVIAARDMKEGRPPFDVLIVGRGGGSLEDLWAFNEEAVARAIAGSGIPVISAVGHEVDFSIADFVADLRAPTPSAAAEMVIQSREELMARVEGARTRLFQAARYIVSSRRNQVQTLERSRGFARVEAALAQAQQRCDEAYMKLGGIVLDLLKMYRQRVDLALERLSPRSLKAELAARRSRLAVQSVSLTRATSSLIRRHRETIAGLEAILRSLSPLSILDRGYAIVQAATTGRVITDAAAASAGDPIRIRLARGRLEAEIKQVRTADGKDGRKERTEGDR